MKMTTLIVALSTLLTALLSCHCIAQRPNDKFEDAKRAIETSNDAYFTAFVKGDSSLFIERYTDDCWIMPANESTLCGIGAALDFFRNAYRAGVRNGKFISIDISGDGREFVTEVGFYHLYDAKNTLLEDGKYLVLWKKTENGWKRFRDSFSPNQ